jgi:HK97 family phage portal protein
MVKNGQTVQIFDGRKSIDLSTISSWEEAGFITGGGTAGLTLAQAYHSVGFLKRCVDLRARQLSDMPYDVMKGSSVVWSSDQERPAMFAWLDLPGFLFRAGASLVLEGQAFGLVAKENGRPYALRYWLPASTEVVYGNNEPATYVRRTSAGKSVPYDPEDVVHIAGLSPYSEVAAGVGDAASALSAAVVLDEITKFQSGNLQSGLVNRALITTKGEPPPEPERSRLKRFIKDYLKGSADPEIIGGDIDVKVVGSNLSDLSENHISEGAMRQIATGCGVPHSLVMSDASNFATAAQDAVNFAVYTVVPDARLFQEELNRKLFSRYGLAIQFRPERLEALQTAQLQQASAAMALTGGEAILSVDEAREIVGKGPQTNAAASADVRRWRQVAERKGRLKSLDFRPDALTSDQAGAIRTRLADDAFGLDEVFRPPFASF